MDTLDPDGRPDYERGQNAGAIPMPGTPMPGTVPGMTTPGTPLPGTEPGFNAWNYRPDAGWSAEYDIVGYHVEATDGGIGKIDEASQAMDESYVVVDTGPWIFGRKVVIPAGTVTHIDHTDRKVYVDRTKAQVKSSPDFDADMYTEPAYRDKVGMYYHDTYGSGTTRGFGQ